ncbi:F-box only protein 38 [Cichlidogyrus casuarinus]|uniref:F-box only protein 38 n=1 Tax=Cichlidogyrus casuarinus TaxID=1844966 RepID=A0ABD2QJI9_9PLAT
MWIAQDACLDTTELRCTNGSHGPQVLTISQPMRQNVCCLLTTLHFEKVGLSHIVLQGAPRLKNLALENCSDLRGIILNGDEEDASVPALRRVRIIRCPKFAILHWLYQCAKLFPRHEENLFITYRPFGQYNSAVERALWQHCAGGHVMVSSDYKQHESERHMEEFHSSFDQLFREVMSFSE